MAEVRGLRELLDTLDGLQVGTVAACRGATFTAAREVQKEAKVKARAHGLEATGALIKNIAVARERGSSTYFEYHIGVRHGRQAKGAQKIAVRGKDGSIRMQYTDDPFYWWFWEKGHYNVFLRAHVPAKAFLRPAMDTKAPELLDVMKGYLATRIERIVAKHTARLT